MNLGGMMRPRSESAAPVQDAHADAESIPPAWDRRNATYRVVGPRDELVAVGTYPKPGPRFVATEFYFPRAYSAVYLLRGSGRYHDERGDTWPLRAGDVFHRLPGLRHWSVPDADGQWLEVFVQLPEAQWRGLVELGLFTEGARPWTVGRDVDSVVRLLQLRDALANQEGAALIALTPHITAVVADWWRRWRDDEQPHARDWLAAVCARLRESSDPFLLPLEDLARSFGMSYHYFRHQFRLRTGLSPGTFRNRMRMERACEQLRTTSRSLADIAQSVGYTNAYAFSREFKKMFGVPPGHFRRPPDSAR